MYGRTIKRAVDFMGALVLLVLASPVILVTAIAVRCFLGSPVLFRQRRPGMDQRSFEVLKFRTMLPEIGPDGRVLPDAARASRFGTLLRSTSLDELPQLVNILRGEMSFVGPRPLLEQYLPYYTEREQRRHSVRPGLTGWSQINGRNGLGWEERLELDAWYVDHVSFALDAWIIVRTIPAVLLRRGVREHPATFNAALDEYRKSLVDLERA